MGGGGAGAISHSAYMETAHKSLLNRVGLAELNTSIFDLINTALVSNPFTGALVYNPDTDILHSRNTFDTIKLLIDAISPATNTLENFTTFRTELIADTATLDVATLDTATLAVDTLDVFVIDETLVKADVAAYSASLEADLTDLTLPKFKASMLNIGATLGSGFVLGEAILRKERLRQIAVFEADLRQKLQIQANDINARFRIQHKDKATELRVQYDELTSRFKLQFKEITAKFKIQNQDTIAKFKLDRWLNIRTAVTASLNLLMKKNELELDLIRLNLEANRLKIIAKTEQLSDQLLVNEHDKKWALDLFAYGTSTLGGIGAGALIPGKKSKAVSALAGALSGAAAGAVVGSAVPGIGNVAGAIGGAVVGATAGALST